MYRFLLLSEMTRFLACLPHQNVGFPGLEVFVDFAYGSFVGSHNYPGTEVVLRN